MPNNVEASIELIEHYSAAARSSLERQPSITPYVQSERVANAYEAARAQQPEETLDERRARAARIAREEQRSASSTPNFLRNDEQYKTRIRNLALGGVGLLFAGAAYVVVTEAVEGVNDLSENISETFNLAPDSTPDLQP